MQDATDPTRPLPHCPRCRSGHVVRNGRNAAGTPTFRCRACGRRFGERPKSGPVPVGTQDRIRRVLGDRMRLRGIARVTGVSRSWVRAFVNAVYRGETPHHPGPLKNSRAGS
jgi:transposase-like protein